MIVKTICRLERSKRFATGAVVAEGAQVDAVRYSRFEAGVKYRRLTFQELERVSAFLGVPVEKIADERGYPLFLSA